MIAGFRAPPGMAYLDTAGYGLPARATLDALRGALERWASGEAVWSREWEPPAERCRELAARLLHAPAGDVALVPAVSLASAHVATAVPEGGEVLVGAGEFRSVLYPFLVAEARGRLRVREAPPEELASAIDERTSLVAVSHVQSADGRVTDVAALARAAHAAGARIYVDATHSAGTLPLDVTAAELDFVACAAYKWLCCPRGVAFFACRADAQERVAPLAAGWRAAAGHAAGGYYGAPLELTPGAARFDLSLAWHAWVGAVGALEGLLSLDDETRFRRGHEVICRLARGLGLPEPPGTILSVPVASSSAAAEALARARVKATVQRDRVRLSAHFYNAGEDADRAVEALAGQAVTERRCIA